MTTSKPQIMATTTVETPRRTGQQVRIQLETQHEDLQPPSQTGPILVPTTLQRQNLSQLVNDILELPSRIPFEFYINARPLRTSLDEWLTAHHVSAETTLNVEYVRAQLPPSHTASFPHDDWVGAVDVLSATSPVDSGNIASGHERILSASFDGCVRVWNMSGQCLATSEGAGAPDEMGNRQLEDGRLPMLQAARFVSPDEIVAGGWRMYLRLWQYREQLDASATSGEASLTPKLDLHGHTRPVNHISVHAQTRRILSAADDDTAMLWSADADNAPAAEPRLIPARASGVSSNKRRKLSTPATPTRGPLATLSAHKGAVKAAIFHPQDATVAYTASSDSTVLTWDLETSQAVSSRTPAGTHTGLRCLAGLKTLGLVAAGTADRRIMLVDPREGAVRQSVGTLRGHGNAVVALDTEPGSDHGLCSASFDGTVRVWDVRSAREPIGGDKGGGATYKISRQSKPSGADAAKVFGVRWSNEVGIVSGGEDKRVQIDACSRA